MNGSERGSVVSIEEAPVLVMRPRYVGCTASYVSWRSRARPATGKLQRRGSGCRGHTVLLIGENASLVSRGRAEEDLLVAGID
jgi:hypothetical protein